MFARVSRTVGPDGKVLEIGFKICLDHRIDMKFCTPADFEITNPTKNTLM